MFSFCRYDVFSRSWGRLEKAGSCWVPSVRLRAWPIAARALQKTVPEIDFLKAASTKARFVEHENVASG